MAAWCRDRGVELAPHGKTHMSPQLFAMQLDGRCVRGHPGHHRPGPHLSRVRHQGRDPGERTGRRGRIAWLAAELDARPGLRPDVLGGLGARRRSDDGRAAGRCPPTRRRLRGGRHARRTHGVPLGGRGRRGGPGRRRIRTAAAGWRRGLRGGTGHQVTPDAYAIVRDYLAELRTGVLRLAPLFETDDVIVTAGGSTYFDAVADVLGGAWPSRVGHARFCAAAAT